MIATGGVSPNGFCSGAFTGVLRVVRYSTCSFGRFGFSSVRLASWVVLGFRPPDSGLRLSAIL